MKNVPEFSILIPAKGRPEMVRDAVQSILNQNFHDYEIIISNNGADPDVRNAISDILIDKRISYLEQDTILPMPEHWEKMSINARGKYLMVLPDRSVLKQGALEKISLVHKNGGDCAKIVSWAWDLFYNNQNILLPTKTSSKTIVISSDELALASISLMSKYPMAIPRGLNSSISLALIEKLRKIHGRAFSPLTPDFSLAYDCMLNQPVVTYLDESLMISQGLSVSNGGTAYLTDASSYVNTLGLNNPIAYSPIKELFVENVIYEDFISACKRGNRNDLIDQFDISNLYIKCFVELNEKRSAMIIATAHLDRLEKSLENSLNNEPHFIVAKVKAHLINSSRIAELLRGVFKRLSRKIPAVQSMQLRVRGGIRFNSIRSASGFNIK